MKLLDNYLNRVTMYRLVVYVLAVYAVVAIAFAQLGIFAASPTAMIISLGVILACIYVADRGLARLLHVPSNTESWLITGLILFLIMPAADSLATGLVLALAAALAGASKFLIAWHGKHLFNPAAFGAAIMTIWGFWPATWWIGSSHFWPLTLVLGLLVARKIRRLAVVSVFFGVAILTGLLLLMHQHQPLAGGLHEIVLASPLFFLGTIMLTEPATMPPRRALQCVFAALVAFLYAAGITVGPLTITPEIALLLGNVMAFAVSPKARARLVLKEVQHISDHVYNFVFTPDHSFNFLPGQYMEWTLAGVPYDSRGNRRTFTIASSPTEPDIHLGIKMSRPASAYKTTLAKLRPGNVVYGAQIAGNFTITGREHEKLAFIAGGIGITPFRSMIKYLTDNQLHCEVVLLYLAPTPEEFAYTAELKAAARHGVKAVLVATDTTVKHPALRTGELSMELLTSTIPDLHERMVYVSGPNSFVHSVQSHLSRSGVPRTHIKTDHFSGY